MRAEDKNMVATIYLKDGMAVPSPARLDEKSNAIDLARLYDDSGVDKIICYDLSKSENEHEKNLDIIREINRNVEIKICGGGNINRIEDIKKLFYCGCVEIILNGSKPETADLVKEAAARFGADKILVSIMTVDFLFKTKDFLEDNIHELLIMDETQLNAVENITNIPYIVEVKDYSFEYIFNLLSSSMIRGVSGPFINDPDNDIMRIKSSLSDAGIKMDNFEPSLTWSDLKLNSDGMVPVVVQDFKTGEVLMVAYMNKQAFENTIDTGKMTYYSRSRKELWLKGETSGHYQYVKSLTADCDYDTILAKVSQVGAACHTGSYSCFFNEIVKKEYIERNPLKVFEDMYDEIKEDMVHPSEGSYINSLMDKTNDELLKKVGEEALDFIIASKNADDDAMKFEISDLLYHLTVLMVKKGITWEDITRELAQR